MPFGIYDEKKNKRAVPLSDELRKKKYRNLVIIESKISDPLKDLITKGTFKPVLKQSYGDTRWAARIRFYKDKPVIHFMNTALVAIPHPSIKETSGIAVLKDIDSSILNNDLTYEINTDKVPFFKGAIMSPEIGNKERDAVINTLGKNTSTIKITLEGVKVYAILQ